MQHLTAAARAHHGGLLLEAVFFNDVESPSRKLQRKLPLHDQSSVRWVQKIPPESRDAIS
jgi:hypothetical protein